MKYKTLKETWSGHLVENNAPLIEIITVINDEKRLKNAQSLKLKNANIFEAVDKNDHEKMKKLIDRYNIKNITPPPTDYRQPCELSDGAVGCLISHILVIEKFLSSPSKYMIVLEDDFKILKKLPETDESIEAMFSEINQIPQNIDILWLHNRIQSNNTHRAIGGIGTEGFILTKHGAKKIYDILKDGCDYAIDCKLSHHHPLQKDTSTVWTKYHEEGIVINGFKSKDVYVGHGNFKSFRIR